VDGPVYRLAGEGAFFTIVDIFISAAWVFASAGALSFIIAVVTISFQAVRAAVVNPVKSLRSE
jgi:hypothetical protein